ncbi:SDR family NAD(P)-dependent oxidoreductase [Paraburkholderia sp. CNPSo 3157]|uniref:SDR family NAD(P)-dependent oxidoreductase n=1 Tax=Paraburkholderia franconis TaxID=2654983 RepID=A0A7X1NEM9_9BURK|nr:SDR family oxidoreductase [Paraburkholderia franconis]MPW20131.1 SDR family NAD(P)-dependent oxidoreductase [Paraburkholderia franconis]
MLQFKGKVAVITGGASGFGREFARLGASLGMKLVLADVQADALDATVNELKTTGAEVIGRRTDVSRSDEVQALADAAVAAFGEVSLLFNNAGVASGGLLWESSEKDWDWVLGVNLRGVIHGVRIFAPLMLAAADKNRDYLGHIVNTASIGGLVTAPMLGPYTVSKHAVIALTESLYHDLGLVTDRVKCSVLCPSFVATGINRSQRNRPAELGAEGPLHRSHLAAQAILDMGTGAGTVSAEQVAQQTFDGIREQRFYICPHPDTLSTVRQRFDDIVALRNPHDPFNENQEMRAKVVATLQG